MTDVVRETRLEYHDDAANSHKYYVVQLLKSDIEGQMVVRCLWGRCKGRFNWKYSRGTEISQTKSVTDNAINAMVVYQNYICEKTKKGYREMQEANA